MELNHSFIHDELTTHLRAQVVRVVLKKSSALASVQDSLKEKLLLDAQRRGKLEDLRNSVREIPPEAALRMFHESIIQDNAPLVESRLQTIPNDLPRCSSS